MLHKAAHVVAARRGIKDTSAIGNRYHKWFVTLAAELGLRARSPDKVTGWSQCTLAGQVAYDACVEVAAGIDRARLPFLIDLASPRRPRRRGPGRR